MLSIWIDEFISTPKKTTFLSTLPSGNENSERESNPISWPLYTYISGSALLASVTPANKQSFKVKSKFKSHDHVSNS